MGFKLPLFTALLIFQLSLFLAGLGNVIPNHPPPLVNHPSDQISASSHLILSSEEVDSKQLSHEKRLNHLTKHIFGKAKKIPLLFCPIGLYTVLAMLSLTANPGTDSLKELKEALMVEEEKLTLKSLKEWNSHLKERLQIKSLNMFFKQSGTMDVNLKKILEDLEIKFFNDQTELDKYASDQTLQMVSNIPMSSDFSAQSFINIAMIGLEWSLKTKLIKKTKPFRPKWNNQEANIKDVYYFQQFLYTPYVLTETYEACEIPVKKKDTDTESTVLAVYAIKFKELPKKFPENWSDIHKQLRQVEKDMDEGKVSKIPTKISLPTFKIQQKFEFPSEVFGKLTRPDNMDFVPTLYPFGVSVSLTQDNQICVDRSKIIALSVTKASTVRKTLDIIGEPIYFREVIFDESFFFVIANYVSGAPLFIAQVNDVELGDKAIC